MMESEQYHTLNINNNSYIRGLMTKIQEGNFDENENLSEINNYRDTPSIPIRILEKIINTYNSGGEDGPITMVDVIKESNLDLSEFNFGNQSSKIDQVLFKSILYSSHLLTIRVT